MDNVSIIEEYLDNKFQAEPFISIIIPYYNEESVIVECHRRLVRVLNQLGQVCEIVYVDDGSEDSSWERLQSLLIPHAKFNLGAEKKTLPMHQVRCLRLSRNFGKEAAMCAGLQQAKGQAVIVLDADLQDPPELIPAMVTEWKKGVDVVDMKRKTRHGESWFKCVSANLYYQLINYLSDIHIPENVGDFRLLDRRVVDEVNRLPERTRFMKGLFAWPGFKRTTLQFERERRFAGHTKWKYSKLLHLAFEGITSFSTKPLRIATIAGLIASTTALLLASFVILKTWLYGDPVAGYPSLISVVLLLGGVQLLSIGVMGEYVGRLFIESKQRPLFVVMENIHFLGQQCKQDIKQ